MTIEAFFVDAIGAALELGVATPEDVLRHVTPEVLARALPRPLWARLFTACLGAPRVDARLVVETLGVPNLCAHGPAALLWACVAEIGGGSAGAGVLRPQPTATDEHPAAAPVTRSGPLVAPPPEAAPPPAPTPAPPPVRGPSIPPPQLAELADELEPESRAPSRPRPNGPRFRASTTSSGRLGARDTRDTRRPQAHAAPPPEPERPVERSGRRSGTEVTDVEGDAALGLEGVDWRESLAVEDSQLVDWQAAEETQAGDDLPRKR